MKGMFQFVKTTVIGGVVFLVPLVIVIVLADKALDIMKKVAEPLSGFIPIDAVGGIAIANVLAVALIVLICLFAGIAARTAAAGRLVHVLESSILSHIPAYGFVKGMTASIAGAEADKAMTAVLARLDDYSQIAFEIERLEGGKVVVYLPGSPNPWSGSVCIMTEDRIQPIDATMISAVRNIKHIGKGSGDLL